MLSPLSLASLDLLFVPPDPQMTAPFIKNGVTSITLDTEPGIWVIETISDAATMFSKSWLLIFGKKAIRSLLVSD